MARAFRVGGKPRENQKKGENALVSEEEIYHYSPTIDTIVPMSDTTLEMNNLWVEVVCKDPKPNNGQE